MWKYLELIKYWFVHRSLTRTLIIGAAAAADLSEASDATLTSKTDLSLLSDEGLELSQRQTDTMFQGPSLDDQAEELIIGTSGMGTAVLFWRPWEFLNF